MKKNKKDLVVELFKRLLIATPQFVEKRVKGGAAIAQKLASNGILQWVNVAGEHVLIHPDCQAHELKKRYGMFKFCERKKKRFPLTPADFNDKPEFLYPRIDHRAFYQEAGTLGLVIVDFSRNEGTWQRLRNRWKETAKQLLDRPPFASLSKSRKLVITALTPFERKVDNLRNDNLPEIQKKVPLRIELIPELAQF